LVSGGSDNHLVLVDLRPLVSFWLLCLFIFGFVLDKLYMHANESRMHDRTLHPILLGIRKCYLSKSSLAHVSLISDFNADLSCLFFFFLVCMFCV
jgi:hypothetical protein